MIILEGFTLSSIPSAGGQLLFQTDFIFLKAKDTFSKSVWSYYSQNNYSQENLQLTFCLKFYILKLKFYKNKQ